MDVMTIQVQLAIGCQSHPLYNPLHRPQHQQHQHLAHATLMASATHYRDGATLGPTRTFRGKYDIDLLYNPAIVCTRVLAFLYVYVACVGGCRGPWSPERPERCVGDCIYHTYSIIVDPRV